MSESSFKRFLNRLQQLDSAEPTLAADALHEINAYFYQKDTGSPKNYSPFEGYWREHHADVLGLHIDRLACSRVAETLSTLWSSGKFLTLRDSIDVSGVSASRIADVRFFTAVQDFKVDINRKGRNPYKDPESELLNARAILDDDSIPHRILEYLGAGGSQTDKRLAWMRDQAKFLFDHYNGSAFEIASKHKFDAVEIKTTLGARIGMGFKAKKADMFLRDMAELGVWTLRSGIDQINVASDANTMRVALRSGIIAGRTPLVSSFLDVHCYQYALVDRLTQEAWRAVWEEWGQLHPESQPVTPASLDFMIYKGLGKTYCKKTPKCKNGCPFDTTCPNTLRRLQPPKSISLLGMTGWGSASSDEGGGLGLSS